MAAGCSESCQVEDEVWVGVMGKVYIVKRLAAARRLVAGERDSGSR